MQNEFALFIKQNEYYFYMDVFNNCNVTFLTNWVEVCGETDESPNSHKEPDFNIIERRIICRHSIWMLIWRPVKVGSEKGSVAEFYS